MRVVWLLVSLSVLLSKGWAKSVPAAPQTRSRLMLGMGVVWCCSSTSHCYGDLGCFSNSAPFYSLYRPLSFFPQSPEVIHPSFNLFTRQAPSTGHALHAGDVAGLQASTFQPARPTKFIVHGFIDNGGTDWMAEMKDEFLKHDDYNVVLVDWGSGSLALYGQATANTRVVGAMIAQLIQFMQNVTSARPEDMHIIGHSLGSHVAGYAGERLTHLGRITGLDPAEPYFQNTDIVVRLDPSDALFVDVIHTDGAPFYSTNMGLGMGVPCGHVDFFPNGGHDQPGCQDSAITHLLNEGLVLGTKEFVACNHLRSYHFFTESINSACPFEGYRCDSEDSFNAGKCVPCSEGGCSYMGLKADLVKPRPGSDHVKYYLKTGAHGPYCRYHHKVALTLASTQTYSHSERGQLFLQLTGRYGQTQQVKVTGDDSVHLQPGHTYTYLMTTPGDLGPVENVSFRWHLDSSLLDVGSWNILGLRHPKLAVDRIEVANGENHRTYNFCAQATPVETDHTQVFTSSC
ncbi:pancreatic triacylglycerol lipase-like [Babylonia areolata]|uniref:pancreatic triacylglycerol lipase-like n=1 Tax=Babylonia areolata TaxID=304850 RepID=UPI003FD0205D